MTHVTYALLMVFFSAQATFAQRIIPEQVLDSIANPKIIPGGDQVLNFENKDLSVEGLSEDDTPATYRFIFRNVSNQPVTLTKVKTSCGCTVVKYSSCTIAPGEKSEVALTYHPMGQSGRIYNRAFVYTNLSDSYPTACLTLTGKVTPSTDLWRDYAHAMGSLRLRNTTVYFNDVPRKLSPSERIECGNSGQTPLKLSVLNGMLPPYVKFRMEPEVLPAGGKGELVITVNGEQLPRDKEQIRFPLVIEGLNGAPSRRTLDVKINTVGQ